MPRHLPISWRDCPGWLVLSGSADPLSEIRAQALSRCSAGGAIAYVSLAHDGGDALLDDMAELGAPAGYVVDLRDPDNNALHERLRSAGMIVIEAGADAEDLRSLMTQTVTHALKQALDQGALLLCEGLAAELAGSEVMGALGELRSGLGLVQDAIIAADAISLADAPGAQYVLADQPDAVFIAIPSGAALALGPERQIETWGGRSVTVSLGSPTSAAHP